MIIKNLSEISKVFYKLGLLLVISLLMSACVTETKVTNGRLNSAKPAVDNETKADNHTQLAASYMQLEQYIVAEQEVTKALEIDPGNSRANYVAALLSLKLERFTEAEKHFEKAIKKDERNSAAAHDYGVYLCRSGRALESISYFDIAIADPLFINKPISYLRAGECIASSDREKAKQYLLSGLKETPGLTPALYRMAEILYLEKNTLQARAYFERYVAVAGTSPQSLLLGYRIEMQANSTNVADQYRTELLQKYPGSKEASTLRKLIGLRG